MKNLIIGVLTVTVLAGLSSCATIMHGSRQGIGISSYPTNAVVTVDGMEKGKTPVKVNLKRKDTHKIRIALNGYKPYEITLTRKVSGWIAGNILFGGLIGLAVDAITGGMYKLSPDQVTAQLGRKDISAVNMKSGLYITVVLKPQPGWTKIGSLKATAFH